MTKGLKLHRHQLNSTSPSTQLQCITNTLSASLEHHSCFGILKNVLKYRRKTINFYTPEICLAGLSSRFTHLIAIAQKPI